MRRLLAMICVLPLAACETAEPTATRAVNPADKATSATPDSAIAPPAPRPTIDAPALDAPKPTDLPGIHNVVTYAPGLYSGSVPEGDAGFATLQAMGIRTIISVDGAIPELEPAAKHGMRYVHLPISYNGMSETRALELARAVRDLPGPVYLHCHHGKHRSAAALGTVVVQLGLATPDATVERMKVSGTAKNYTGLYACVQNSRPVDATVLDTASTEFPEVSRPSGLVNLMVDVDEVHEHLKGIEKAGWAPPQDHPDLVPLAEAARLVDLFRSAAQDPAAAKKPPEFFTLLETARKNAEALEHALQDPVRDDKELAARVAAVTADCKSCHVKYRD